MQEFDFFLQENLFLFEIYFGKLIKPMETLDILFFLLVLILSLNFYFFWHVMCLTRDMGIREGLDMQRLSTLVRFQLGTRAMMLVKYKL